MNRINISYTTIFFAGAVFVLIIMFGKDNSKEILMSSVEQVINSGNFIFYVTKPVEGYQQKTSLVRIAVRNLTTKSIVFTSYLTGNTSEDIYQHYYLFVERQSKIYSIKGEFIAVSPTDGTNKYDGSGRLLFDIPIDEINQYTYLVVSRDKKAEDIICKISLNK